MSENAPGVTQDPPTNTPPPAQEPPANQPPANQPPAAKSWKEEFLPEDLRAEKSLADYKDDPKEGIASLAKSFVNLQKHMGNAISIPGEDASEEDVAKFYGKLGRPEAPDKYDYKKPEDLPEVTGWNDEAFNKAREAMFAMGYTQKQFEGAMDLYHTMARNSWIESEAAKDQERKNTYTQLKKEWGSQFDARYANVVHAVRQLTTQEEFEEISQKGYANDPIMARIFEKVGERMRESKDLSNLGYGQDILDPSTARIESNRIRTNKDHPLHEAYMDDKHPQHRQAVERIEQLTQIYARGVKEAS